MVPRLKTTHWTCNKIQTFCVTQHLPPSPIHLVFPPYHHSPTTVSSFHLYGLIELLYFQHLHRFLSLPEMCSPSHSLSDFFLLFLLGQMERSSLQREITYHTASFEFGFQTTHFHCFSTQLLWKLETLYYIQPPEINRYALHFRISSLFLGPFLLPWKSTLRANILSFVAYFSPTPTSKKKLYL